MAGAAWWRRIDVLIIVTATATEEPEAKQPGVTDFLVKPFTDTILREKIDEYVNATIG